VSAFAPVFARDRCPTHHDNVQFIFTPSVGLPSMQRRALLASLPTVLAGCSVAPASPSTTAYPASQPNIFVSFNWDSDRSELAVRFERGNQLTAANTALLVVRTEADTLHRTVWVASDEVSDRGDPVDTFPISPGASVIHEMPEPAAARLVWVAPDGNRSRAVAQWTPPTQSATPTSSSTDSTTVPRTGNTE
jgi:hypothetical protein